MSLQVTRIAEGLWQWGVADGDAVALGTYVETPHAIVLIDPPLPVDGTADRDRFWTYLARDVARRACQLVVALTAREHSRGARALAERFDAPIWCPPESLGTDPDPEVRVVPVADERVAFYLDRYQALVLAADHDAVLTVASHSLTVRQSLSGRA